MFSRYFSIADYYIIYFYEEFEQMNVTNSYSTHVLSNSLLMNLFSLMANGAYNLHLQLEMKPDNIAI